MATVVNTPSTSDTGGGMGFLIGMILLAVVLFLLFVYGLPLLNQAGRGGGTGTNINIPDQIDVNMQNPQQ